MFNLDAATLFLLLGVLVFVVNVIVEVTKNIYPLDQVHTNYYVAALSIVLTVLTYFVYLSYAHVEFVWYYLLAAIVAGFIVAYLSMFGWDKLIKLWKSSNKRSDDVKPIELVEPKVELVEPKEE